jgi:hypothetical protein
MSDEKTVKDTAPPEEGVSRRQLLVRSIAGAAAASAAGLGAYAHHKTKGTPHDEMPVGIKDDLEPMDQRDMLWTFVVSAELRDAHPERVEAFGGFDFHEKLTTTYMKGPYKDVPGYNQIDRALSVAAWEGNTFLAPGQQYGQPNSGILHWDQSDVNRTQYEFESKDEATLAIRSAARVFKATRCGVTRPDPRWNFDPIYDLENERTLSWEDDFPFFHCPGRRGVRHGRQVRRPDGQILARPRLPSGGLEQRFGHERALRRRGGSRRSWP